MASIVDNSNEESVQLTADDALVSKQSAANLGYFNDRFLSCFVKRPSKRSPLINRGYYARVAAIQTLIVKFLEKCWDLDLVPQVVSLGGGFDTTFFRIKDEGLLKGDITCTHLALFL